MMTRGLGIPAAVAAALAALPIFSLQAFSHDCISNVVHGAKAGDTIMVFSQLKKNPNSPDNPTCADVYLNAADSVHLSGNRPQALSKITVTRSGNEYYTGFLTKPKKGTCTVQARLIPKYSPQGFEYFWCVQVNENWSFNTGAGITLLLAGLAGKAALGPWGAGFALGEGAIAIVNQTICFFVGPTPFATATSKPPVARAGAFAPDVVEIPTMPLSPLPVNLRALNALLANQLMLLGHQRALAKTSELAYAADQAGDKVELQRQTKQGRALAAKVSQLLRAEIGLRQSAADQLVNARLDKTIFSSDVAEAQQKVAATGLPAALKAQIRQLGGTDDAISVAAQSFIGADPSYLAGKLSTRIYSPSINTALNEAANQVQLAFTK